MCILPLLVEAHPDDYKRASLNQEEDDLPRAVDPGIFLVVKGYLPSVPFRPLGGRSALSL